MLLETVRKVQKKEKNKLTTNGTESSKNLDNFDA